MALLKFKRSAVPAKIPSIADLDLGELAINTYDGKVYTKKDDGTQSIVEVGGTASTTNTILLPVRNNTGATLTKGTAVYINGALGQNPTVTKAIATSDATSAQTLGLVSIDLPNNTVGNVTLIGSLDDVDTSAYTDGAQLYLSPTTAGALTATKPYAPNHLVYIAVVEYAHPTHGKLFVKVQNGYEMDELHDVSAQNPANNDGLFYNTTSGLWEKKSIATALGFTPASTSGPTFNNGVTVNNGSNQVQIAYDGNIEIIRAGGGAYIDLKDSTGEDFDIRLQASGNQLNIAAAGGLTLNGAGVLTGITSGQVTTALGYTPANKAGDTFNGVVSIYSSNDAQLYLNGNGTSWAGMSWADVSGSDFIWYNGSTSTFAIGGGGSFVANKKLHVHGGMTIGSGLAMSASGTNSLLVENEVSATIFRDSQNSAYFVDPDGTSNLNKLTASNRSMVGSATISMSGLDANTWYPVTIPLPVGRQTTLRIENALNSNVPSWSTHGGGFSCYFEWTSNGSGWGTIPVSRRITDWREAFTSVQIVGGIDQMTFSSQEVIWLRGGANYFFSADCDVTPTIRTTSYDAYGQVVAPRSTVFNDPWTMVAGKMSYGTFQASDLVTAANSVRAPLFYDNNDTAYFIDPNSTSRLSVANVNFLTLLNDEGLNVKGIRGQFSAGSDGQGISLFSNVDIGYPSGWGSGLGNTPSRGLSIYGGLRVAYSGGGFITSDTSVRAPIFYDSNDTSYYVDANSTSVLNGINVWGEIGARRNDVQSILRSYNLSAGSPLQFYLDHNYGNVNIGNSRGVVFAGGSYWEIANSVRAPIFYDSNDTGYYVDPNSTSRLSLLTITGELTVPTNSASYGGGVNFGGVGVGSFIRGTTGDGASATTSNLQLQSWFGIGFGPSISGQTVPVGENAVYIDTRLGDLTARRIITGSSDVRAPIFYDSNNTGFYLDPYGTSNVEMTCLGSWYFKSNRDTSSNSAPLQAYSDGSTGATMAFHRAGVFAVNMGLDSDNVFRIGGWSASNGLIQLDMSGNFTALTSSRAPIFYDSNNTGFYVDPNSSSRLERLVLSARYDNYFVGSMAVVNAVNNFQTLTDTFGQMNVMQVSDTSGFTNGPTGLYPYGAVMSWRTENHSYQMYASHTGDLAYKTQWNNDNYSGWQTPVIYGRIGNSASGRSIYGSVYYDTDNTGYFLNPTGTSTLANLDVASVIDSAAYYDAAIEIRERAFGGVLTTGLNNAPRLGFHWGGRVAMQLVLDSGGTFNVMNGDCSAYSAFRAGDCFGNVFYEASNNAFYLDPASTGTSLNVAGSIVAAGNVTAYSDIRIKANVETIPSALDKLDQIRGVTYTRTDLDDKEQRYAGVIAQEIEAVLPEAVRDLGNIKAVDYNATIALLIQAVKELRDEVEALRK